MADKILLSKPIMVNGSDVKELSYDIDSITPEQAMEAEKRAAMNGASKGLVNFVPGNFNQGYQFYLGCFAIINVNPSIDIMDMARVKGRDYNKIVAVGASFFVDTSPEESMTEATPSVESPSDSSSGLTVVSMENAPSLLDD